MPFFSWLKRKGKCSGGGGRWERGKGKNLRAGISSAPLPQKNSKPFYAVGAAAILALHFSSLRADRGRKFCGRLDPAVVSSGIG